MKARRWLVDNAFGALVLALLLLSAALATFPLARMFYDGPVNFNEGWNAYLQLRAASGEPLYSGYSPFFFCNYTPLSFYLIGGLGQLFGDVVLAGRLVSLVSFIALAGACARIVWLSGGRYQEMGLTLVTLSLPLLTLENANLFANEPQMLAMALSFCGLALHLGGPLTERRAIAVAGLLALSLLTKHNILAVPIVIAIDVAVRGSGKVRAAFFGSAMAFGVAAAILLWFREGSAFYAQLLAPRIWSADWAVTRSVAFLNLYKGLMLMVVALLIVERKRDLRIAAVAVLTFAIAAIFVGGAGVANNIFMDCLIAAAIASGILAARVRQQGACPLLALAIVLVANSTIFPLLRDALREVRHQVTWKLARHETLIDQDLRYLSTRPGLALCEASLPCFRAGKPMAVDAFNTRQAIATGRMAADALDEKVARAEFLTIMIYPRPVGRVPNNFGFSFYDTLEQHYRLDRVGHTMQFWVPRVRTH